MSAYAEFAEKFNLKLNEQQARAVQSTDSAVLLLAVPGSGKTTTLVARIGYLIHAMAAAPESILTMTYTVAASADMRARYIALFGDEYAGRLEFRTINAVCAQIIRDYLRLTGGTSFRLAENTSVMLADIFQRLYGEYPDEAMKSELQRIVTYAKNMRLKPEDLESLTVFEKPAAPLYSEYVREMTARGLMDFDDQLVFARRILLKYPALLSRYRERYKYICVDEAQDSSMIQHELIRLLIGEGGILFMVGDEDQSIYGFRAAYPDALLQFERGYSAARVLLLENNYRSTPQIISAADRFIAQNTMRREKHMRAARVSGAPVRRVTLNNRAAQYTYITRLIQAAPERELAILFRNNDSALPLIDALDRGGISYRCRQSEKSLFFSSRTVCATCDILSLALDPTDAEAFMRIYYMLGVGVTRELAEAAVRQCAAGRYASLFDALAACAVQQPWLHERLEELALNMRALKEESARAAMYRLRSRMGFESYVRRANSDAERLYLLSALAMREGSVESFLARLARLKDLVLTGGDKSAKVILSTIHSSKGLEYERVIIMDAIKGILPQSSAPESDAAAAEKAAYEEERRLFYVGATRAKDELILLGYSKESCPFVESFCAADGGIKADRARKPLPGGLRGLSLSMRRTSAAPSAFIPGAEIIHKDFGEGRIREVNGDIARVSFSRVGEKTLSIPVCLSYGIVKMK